MGPQAGVQGSQGTKQGDDPDALVLHPHQIPRHALRQVKGDGEEKGHARVDALEETERLLDLLF